MEEKLFGKTLENSIKMRSINASLAFLNNLVSENGNHFIYHRLQSMFRKHPIDCYEIYTSDGKYDQIYIDVYHPHNEMIPPYGYLFEYNSFEFIEEDYNTGITFNDSCEIDNQYVYTSANAGQDFSFEKLNNVPLLEKYIDGSVGVNCKVKNFPDDLIKEVVSNSFLYLCKPDPNIIESILKEVTRKIQ